MSLKKKKSYSELSPESPEPPERLKPSDPEELSRTSSATINFRNFSTIPTSQRAAYSRKLRRRLIHKNGEVNIRPTKIQKRRRHYLADIFTTLLDIQWRWSILLFILAFFISWILFAVVWWLICFSHGDFNNYGSDGWNSCVESVHDFTTALLFSIETQHTIGYGSRHTNEHCPEAIFVMMIQSCVGVIIQALMTGLVFAKLARAKKRAQTLIFSKNAVICKRDDQLCLLFRVGDMRKSHIIEAHVTGVLVKKRVTLEGEVLPLERIDIDVGFADGRDRLFLIWPVIVEHRINEDSPFYDMSYEDLLKENFEIIMILEGVVESTGNNTQARSSYIPGEIMWGHRFERLVTFQKENGQYQIDYTRFHAIVPVDTPTCSARELEAQTKDSSSSDSDDDKKSEEKKSDESKSDDGDEDSVGFDVITKHDEEVQADLDD